LPARPGFFIALLGLVLVNVGAVVLGRRRRAALRAEGAECVTRGAGPDFDRIDAMLESALLFRVPAAWQPDDEATARSSGEDRENAVQARDLLAERMAPAQIAEAQRRARVWTPPPEP